MAPSKNDSVEPPQKPLVIRLNPKSSVPASERKRQQLHAEIVGTELSKDLTKKLESGRYECVICITSIGRKAEVWACSDCFVVMHLSCVQKWASKSKSDNWRCPHCQHVETQPPRHICFCEKMVRPEFDPYLVINSCGEVCEKPRLLTDCPHTCNLVCHPGPCPPCLLMGPERSCHCGKRQYRLKCSDVEINGSSCGEPCGRPLKCQMHVCEEPCHSGPCGSCKQTELQTCYCGSTQTDRPCGSGEPDVTQSMNNRLFSCGNVCNQTLKCGNHQCQRQCHVGSCNVCETSVSVISHCSCGQTPLQPDARSSCLDPIPTCDKICSRLMPCGHKCDRPCHQDACHCDDQQKVTCRCGASRLVVKCELIGVDKAPIMCHQTCSARRSCGKHECNQICCLSYQDKSDAAGMHVCRRKCGKKLSCGNHFCEDDCHKGRCDKCPHAHFDEWHCPCGRTIVYPPRACGFQAPRCKYTCARPPRACGHVDLLPHLCHPDSVMCPPCVVLLQDVACACGSEVRQNVHCHQAHLVTCGRPCGAALECGLHTCPEPCHQHLANPQAVQEGCGHACAQPLPGCGHSCPAPCHPQVAECPTNVVCKRRIVVTCPCGRKSVNSICGVLDSQPTIEQPVLECDDLCARELRKQQLAEAFGKQHQAWQDSQMLVGLARTHPALLRRIEQQFLFLLTKNSGFEFTEDAIVPNIVLPSMTAAQRKLAHLVAESFGLQSESFGQDSSRAVWITLRPNSHPPNTLLSHILLEQEDSFAAGANPSDSGLLFSHMGSGVSTKHLQEMLEPWRDQFAIHWIDNSTCLVIFDDPNTARIASNTLRGPFQISFYREKDDSANVAPFSNPLEEAPAVVVAENELKPTIPISPKIITIESLRPPPPETSNAFDALLSKKKEKPPQQVPDSWDKE